MTEIFVPKKLDFKISEVKKKQGRECCAYGCKSKPHPKKVGLCHKHYSIYRRVKDPVYDRYVNFKRNALRRKKEFSITLHQFRKFCAETGYIIKKGMRGAKCTIDRIRNNEGYHIGNIQILTMKANINKYYTEDKNDTNYTQF